VIVLGLDTATTTAGIAIVDDDRVLAEGRHDTSGRGADLLVKIDQLVRSAGLTPTALDAVAIGAGPGSFTGLRIGMATAKGIAFAARRPLWAVSSLAALAEDARDELGAAAHPEAEPAEAMLDRAMGAPAHRPSAPILCAALDARRGEVFAGCYRHGVPLAPERVMAPSALGTWVAELLRAASTGGTSTVWFAGDAVDAHRAMLASLSGERPWLAARTPSGRAVARLALAGARVDVTVGGVPTYIRPSEAEVMYPDGVPGAIRRR
jgi:tRNA threonylcarbamoyladenosine biosynthesis protein TsaB